jgi:tRNA1Val (adenine37-N6)-methyltransferase
VTAKPPATESSNRATSLDALFDGSLRFRQPVRGYRVNVDAILIAHFAAGRRARLLADLGAGVGAIAIALHHLGDVARAILIEQDAWLLDLAVENAARVGLSVTPLELTLGSGRLPPRLVGTADLVVCNPPFFLPETLRPPKLARTLGARVGSLRPFVAAAARLVSGKRGRAIFAYPAQNLPLLLACAESEQLRPKRLRAVHANRESPARIVLVELRKANAGGLVIEPPLYEWEGERKPSTEMAKILRGERAPG